MENKKTTVFISYNQKSGDIIADKIQNRLDAIAQVVRDKTSIVDWGSIKAFMKSIRNQDMVVMIITEEYLRSSGCMFEVVEVMRDEGWNKHVMFVVADEAADIYTPKNWPRYLEYWKKEEKDLNCAIESVGDAAQFIKLAEELNKVKSIEASLIDFLSFVADSRNPNVDEAVEKIYQRVCANLPEAEDNEKRIKIDGSGKAVNSSEVGETIHLAVTDYFEDRIIYVGKSEEEPEIKDTANTDWGINKCVHMPVLFLIDASASMALYMELICNGIQKFVDGFVENAIKDHHEEHMLKVPSVDIGVAVYNDAFELIQTFTEASSFPFPLHNISTVGTTNLYTGFCGASEYLIEYIREILCRGEEVLAATVVVLGEGISTEPITVLCDGGACPVLKNYEFQLEMQGKSLKLSDIYYYIPVVLQTGYDGGMQTAVELYKLFPEWYRTEERIVHRVKIDDVGEVFYWIQILLQFTSQYKGMRKGKFSVNAEQEVHTPWIESLMPDQLFDYLFWEYEQALSEFSGQGIQNVDSDVGDIFERVFQSVLSLEHEGIQPTEIEIVSYLGVSAEMAGKALQSLLKDGRIRKIGMKENASYRVIRPSERENRSGMYLSGSARTGDKILKHSRNWTCTFCGQEMVSGGILYHFQWSFHEQYGNMSIIVRDKDGKMSNSSLIDTEPGSPHEFDRPLGLYNDGSMLAVFEDALQSIGVKNYGVYAERV